MKLGGARGRVVSRTALSGLVGRWWFCGMGSRSVWTIGPPCGREAGMLAVRIGEQKRSSPRRSVCAGGP